MGLGARGWKLKSSTYWLLAGLPGGRATELFCFVLGWGQILGKVQGSDLAAMACLQPVPIKHLGFPLHCSDLPGVYTSALAFKQLLYFLLGGLSG